MTLGALEHRDVAEVDRVLEGLVCRVAGVTFTRSETAEVDGMFEGSGVWVLFNRTRGVVEHGVADVAIVADDFARAALVLAVVTTESSGRYQMTDVVGMRLPVSLHLRKEVDLVDALHLFDGPVDCRATFGIK